MLQKRPTGLHCLTATRTVRRAGLINGLLGGAGLGGAGGLITSYVQGEGLQGLIKHGEQLAGHGEQKAHELGNKGKELAEDARSKGRELAQEARAKEEELVKRRK